MSMIIYGHVKAFTGAIFSIFLLTTNSALSLDLFSNVEVLQVNIPHRAGQGVAVGDGHLFLTTSTNAEGRRENIISEYSMDGKLLKQKRNASNILDRDGRFMDFGDGTVVGKKLYVTLYNWNSLPSSNKSPLYSKIAVFDTKNLFFQRVYEIGGNTAEGIAYHDGYFWTAYHDEPLVKQFDSDFKLFRSFTLVMPSDLRHRDGFVQGMVWYGNDIFLNIHGPNVECSFYSPGLVRYHYNESQFEYVETVPPPTYGAGQGIDVGDNTFYFIDRPWNGLIQADFGDLKPLKHNLLTTGNDTNVISSATSISTEIKETVYPKNNISTSNVVNFLNSSLNILERSGCERSSLKTKIINEINNETQKIEGLEETHAIIRLEIDKAFNSLIHSSNKTDHNIHFNIILTYSSKRIDPKSISCEIVLIIK